MLSSHAWLANMLSVLANISKKLKEIKLDCAPVSNRILADVPAISLLKYIDW